MINSILKVVTGVLKLRGNTDDTLIGNTADSLKVSDVDLTTSYPPTTPYTVSGPARLKTDPDGQLITRGDILTDEGSLRDDFTGNNTTGWQSVATGGGGAAITVANSIVSFVTGTNASTLRLYRFGDYGPMSMSGVLTISQRIAADDIRFGFRDSATNPNVMAEFQFTSTNPTLVNTITTTAANAANTETVSNIVLPNNANTAQSNIYTIDVTLDAVTFFVNGVQVSQHKTHIPGPYDAMNLHLGSTRTAAASTTYTADWISFTNQNNLQMTNTFDGAPVSVASREDQHHATSNVTTTGAAADQIITTITVPASKVMYLVGYSINSNNVGATVVKIGKGTLVEPGATTVDSIIFRAFPLAAGSSREEQFATPRRVGQGGDVVKIAVTPAANQSTIWRGTFDYILR